MTNRKSYRGEVVKVFRGANEGFCAGVLTTSGENVKFKATFLLMEGDLVAIEGAWVEHQKYGATFEVNSYSYLVPDDKDGLVRWLTVSPEFKNIGYARAAQIVKEFGSDFTVAINVDDNLARIANIAHVDQETALKMRECWNRRLFHNAVSVELAGMGLNYAEINMLVARHGENAAVAVKNSPYEVLESLGVRFTRIDAIARRNGVGQYDYKRLRAATMHMLRTIADSAGHSLVPKHELLYEVADKLLKIPLHREAESRLSEAVRKMIDDEYVVNVGGFIGIEKINRLENVIKDRIESWDIDARPSADDVDSLADRLELNTDQRAAVSAAAARRLVVVTGAAGTGKTYTLSAIATLARERGQSVALCAPTGKAAKRMEEFIGVGASTIHRMLEWKGSTFGRPDAVRQYQYVIVDEVSMCNIEVLGNLIEAISDSATLVLAGDHNQLPAIGAGNILRDTVELYPMPVLPLTEVVRHAGALKRHCTEILAGQFHYQPVKEDDKLVWCPELEFDDMGDLQERLVELAVQEYLTDEALSGFQILAPMKKRGVGTEALNTAIQAALLRERKEQLQPGRRFAAHDRVIQMKNDYNTGIMNGTIGEVVNVLDTRGTVIVRFQGEDRLVEINDRSDDLQLAYALTIHKAQGSEFLHTLVVVHDDHQFMLNRNLLYTAATRARVRATFLGTSSAIDLAMSKVDATERNTLLRMSWE